MTLDYIGLHLVTLDMRLHGYILYIAWYDIALHYTA